MYNNVEKALQNQDDQRHLYDIYDQLSGNWFFVQPANASTDIASLENLILIFSIMGALEGSLFSSDPCTCQRY